MQATQSSTALEMNGDSRQFVALRRMSRAWGLGTEDGPRRCRPAAGMVRVAEGAGLAHDAGNLLGALRLYSDLLAMPGVLTEEHKEYAAELRLLSDRSWALIDRLVDHGRAEQAALTRVMEVLARCRGVLSRVAGRTVQIACQEGGFWPVDVATEAVERIVTNLVKNAAEATSEEGEVLVTLRGVMVAGGRRVVLTVSDTGCGMDEGAVQALQDAAGVGPTGGRGIGFRVVRELVAQSGGWLSVLSEPGEGTSVSVEWPAGAEVMCVAALAEPFADRSGDPSAELRAGVGIGRSRRR